MLPSYGEKSFEPFASWLHGDVTDFVLVLDEARTPIRIADAQKLIEWCWFNELPMLTSNARRDWLYNGAMLPGKEELADSMVSREAYDYWHYVLFYFTGRTVSEVVGDPDYVPYSRAVGLTGTDPRGTVLRSTAEILGSRRLVPGTGVSRRADRRRRQATIRPLIRIREAVQTIAPVCRLPPFPR